MGKSNHITADNLLDEFCKEYESEKEKFLLFDLANANENANTTVLKLLLEFGEQRFLNSLLERIGLPKRVGNAVISDQSKAIGPKETGFIDMYVMYDDVHVIFENKIYGAADTEKQIARYVATVEGVQGDDFSAWYAQPSVAKNIHVVYLTADGMKQPSEDSLPAVLREKIEYYPVSYQDDILPWLEEDVLPNLPYCEDGIMIAGVRQYIAFLKHFLTKDASQVVDAFVRGLDGGDVKKYVQLMNAFSEENHRDVPENVSKSLRRQLVECAESIFCDDVDGDWKLHFTPSFVILYKESWAAVDQRKYAIPSFYLVGTPTENFLKNGCFKRVMAAVDHLPAATKDNVTATSANLPQFSNHGKTAGFDLTDLVRGIHCSDVNDRQSRKEFYHQLIDACSAFIARMDQAALAIQDNGVLSQVQLLNALLHYSQEN